MDGTRSLVSSGQLFIYGVIDPDAADGDGIRAIDVIDSLAQLSGQPSITVRINSPGGSCVEGIAIYNALRAAGKPIVTQVDGIAASAASVVFLAGDTRLIAESASVMIHDPWAMAVGTSDDLRASADECDRQRGIITDLYVQRTGQPAESISAMMSAETYLSASEAIDFGFATELSQPLRVAACERLDPASMAKLLLAAPSVQATAGAAPVPAARAATPPKEHTSMTTPAERGATGGEQTAAQTQAPDINAVRMEAATAERARVAGIYQAVRAAKLDHGVADEFIASGVSLAQAQGKIIERWSAARESEEGFGKTVDVRSHVTVAKDAQERWAEGAEQGLAMRAGLVKADRSNEFYGLTLAELARSSLSVRNERASGLGRMDMVGRAFTVRAAGPGYNSTSDFPSILQNVAYKALMKGYSEVDETFDLWTSKGTLSDFRPAYRVDSGLFPALDTVPEGGEYRYGTTTDSGTMVALATYGKMFAITRQAIVNDDLDYFNKIPAKMGRAAKRTIGNLVYAIVNTNPLMQDGAALFSSAHGNLAGSAAAPSAATIGAARSAMARQKDDAGLTTGVGIRPKFILVGPELLDSTNTVLRAEYLPGDPGFQPNYVRGAVEPISDGRLNASSWFLAADPALTDTIEVSYLDGNEEPYLDEKQGWNVDGVEYKVRIDAGVKALHWRGLYKGA